MDSVSYCGLDPEDRKWKPELRLPRHNFGLLTPRPYFGFVARKPGTLADNQCHVFVQLEPEQPASAIINFVSKVMQASEQGRQKFL
jgi:tensin